MQAAALRPVLFAVCSTIGAARARGNTGEAPADTLLLRARSCCWCKSLQAAFAGIPPGPCPQWLSGPREQHRAQVAAACIKLRIGLELQ